MQTQSIITSVVEFQSIHGITLPRNQHWYPILPKYQLPGEVNALHRLRGIPRITNGIEVYIERGDGELLLVHKQWFVYDPEFNTDHSKAFQEVSDEDRAMDKLRKQLQEYGINVTI